MARPLRIEYPGAVYHVMNRGRARQPVFRDPTNYETFLQVVRDTHALWGIEFRGPDACFKIESPLWLVPAPTHPDRR